MAMAMAMANPLESDVQLLVRVARYLKLHRNIPLTFPWDAQPTHPGLQVFTDSDWASCESTRKSRSGGTLLYRGRLILHYCRTQDTIALSSGEAELKSTCKGMLEGLGLRALVEFLTGEPCLLEHLTDAQANMGIVRRQGCGGLKHLTIKQLWCQSVARMPHTTMLKVPRRDNPADMLCSAQSAESLSRQMRRLHFHL